MPGSNKKRTYAYIPWPDYQRNLPPCITLRLKKTVEDSGKPDIAEDLSLAVNATMEKYSLCWKARQENKDVDYPGGSNGGGHGLYFVCSSGQSGSFTANAAASYAHENEVITMSSQISKS